MNTACVIVRLHDGLGNQMFQYAAARSVSLKRRLPLKLDVHHYESQNLRRFRLDAFRIRAGFSRPEESPVRFLPEHKRPRANFAGKVLRKLFPADPVPVYSEKRWWKFDPEIFSGSGPVYLNGYWQTEKYFEDITSVIREDFRLKSGGNGEEAARLDSENSVSVHVRRKDFVGKGIALPLDYYARAIQRLRQSEKGLRFYFFSDEPAWVREHLFPLVFPAERGRELSAASEAEEMKLMSHCRHHVIANSTFSWWAAWLCGRPGKSVTAPKVWWKTKKDGGDLIPSSWVRL